MRHAQIASKVLDMVWERGNRPLDAQDLYGDPTALSEKAKKVLDLAAEAMVH